VPHLPLGADGSSTLDAAGPGFALLTGEDHELWRRAADEVEDARGVAVAVTPVDPAGLTGAVLVRPDGVIAWKPGKPAAEAAGQLGTVLAGLLSRIDR